MQGRLQLTFAGADSGRLIERAFASGLLPETPPTAVTVDFETAAATQPLAAMAASHDELDVRWGLDAAFQVGRKHDHTYIHRTRWDLDPEELLATLGDWPFEACSTTPVDPVWWPDYRSIHGWCFLLKGSGHRLVSERIVDRGPWRRLRDEANDVTLFQFHDLAADAETALAQARPGHALLAPVWLGGHYASQLWLFKGAARDYKPSFYDPETRTSIVLVQEREVSPEEMAIASATRVHEIFLEPVEQVAFVYFDEQVARRQLPELWLHGLEVRAMTAEGERRIDHEFEPPAPPAPPAWTRSDQP